MPEDQIRAYDPRRGDWALDLPSQPGPAASIFDQIVWWLSNQQMAKPGITAGVMPYSPKQIGTTDDILRDISGRMAMLLRAKAPIREADPRIIAQIGSSNSMRGSGSPPGLESLWGSSRSGRAAHRFISGDYSPSMIDTAFRDASDYNIVPLSDTIRRYVANNLDISTGSTGGTFPVLSMKTDWFGKRPTQKQVLELMKRGLYP